MAFGLRRGSPRSYEMDMCNGPLLGKIIRYTIPLMLSSVLQLLFNAADIVVVGRFAGPTALAAVGSTGAVTNLMINMFMGLSIGTNVMVARYYGAQKYKDLRESVHTTIAMCLIIGFGLIFVGCFAAKPMLSIMGCPHDVIDQATLYMQIYFVSMPAVTLYNFGSAILRAVGDTRRPLYYLSLAGALNVVINLLLVIVFHMGVAGVAIATAISQYVSALLVFHCLVKSEGIYSVNIKEIRLTKDKCLEMIKIGLPAGIQGSVFSLSNTVIQSSVNSFGSTVMAGNTAASNLEGFVYASMNAFYQSALSFTSQNMGAKKYSRVKKIMFLCLSCVTVTGLVLGVGAYILRRPLLGIYTSDPEVIKYGMIRLYYICLPYFICGLMDVMVGILRGMGYDISPMIISLTGACVFRIVWIFTVFRAFRSLDILYLSYVLSWILTGGAHFVCYLFARRKIPKTDGEPMPAKKSRK